MCSGNPGQNSSGELSFGESKVPVVSFPVIFLLVGTAELFGGDAVAEKELSFCDSQTALVAQGPHQEHQCSELSLIPPKSSQLRAGFGIFSGIHFL